MTLPAGLLLLLLAAPPAADVEKALGRVRASERYQTELPRAAAPGAPEPTRDVAPPRRAAGRLDPADESDLRPVGSAVLWLLAGALGIGVAAWVAREVQAKRRARAAIAPLAAAAAAVPAAAPAAAPPRHEALALRGEYGEAIHAILVSALAAIGRAHAGMRPAWTSREILVLVTLEGQAQRALASLVRLVEVTRFGGAPAREEEYRLALGWLGAIAPREAA